MASSQHFSPLLGRRLDERFDLDDLGSLAEMTPFLPMVSALVLYFVSLGLVAQAAPANSKNFAWIPIIGVTTSVLCMFNLGLAYVLCRLLKLNEASARAIMFDVGSTIPDLARCWRASISGPSRRCRR
jgi:predicted Na+-dependent transporter